MALMKLTEQQLGYMNTFGFLHFPGLLADRIDEIIEAFDAVWTTHGGGHGDKPHDGQSRSCIVPFIDQSEYLSSLLDDPRIAGIATSLMGEDFNYLGSDGNFYVGDTGWHSDGGWPRPVVYYKFAMYLDSLTGDTGSIRVIPGSHHYGDRFAEGLQKGVREGTEETWGVSGDLVPACALETEPGDVVVFNQGTKHSAWGGGSWRRMFTMNFSRRHTEEELPILRTEVSKFARFWVDSVYGDALIDTAGPERMRHLEQALANQDHLPGLSQEARDKMGEPSRG